MRTADLERVLAADAAPERPVGPGLALALLAGGAVALAAVVLLLGLRPDLPTALGTLRVAVKQAWPIWLAVAAAGAALRLASPGRPARRWLAALAVVPALLAVAVAAELLRLPAADWRAALMGSSAGPCLGLVTGLSLPILGMVLWALRRGASLSPARSGALAGLLSGAMAASLYALHCTEDSPLFYAVWYVAAILAVTGLGALLGRRILRW